MIFRTLIYLLFLCAQIVLTQPLEHTQIHYFEGRVISLDSSSSTGQIKLRNGETITAFVPNYDPMPGYKVGQIVEVAALDQGDDTYYEVIEWVRRPVLGWLLALFVVVTLFIARLKGLRAILATSLSLVIVIMYIVPQILAGHSPVMVSLIGAGGILLLAIYFVHGFNWSTSAALVGTLATVILTLALGQLFIYLSHLTGFGSEEALYFNIAADQINLRGLILAGLIIGSLGALTDTSVVQASLVRELSHVNPKLGTVELYQRGMAVGRDHIGSLVNTLVFAYAGAALPMMLMLLLNDFSLAHALNMELIATEIVHTLVGSMGLVWAVPLTTFLAAMLFRGDKLAMQQNEHSHAGFSKRDEQLAFQRSRQLELLTPISPEEALEELRKRSKS